MEMKTQCERCGVSTPEDGRAFVCSFECTWCPTCAAELGVCPNCGGELVARPRRGDPEVLRGAVDNSDVELLATKGLNPTTDYFFMEPGSGSHVEPNTPDFWPLIDTRTELHRGRLLCGFAMTDSWGVWEMHPMGNEVVQLTAGRATVYLRSDLEGELGVDDPRSVSLVLEAPEYVVVPAGVWHTLDVIEPGSFQTITWGEGTQNRPR